MIGIGLSVPEDVSRERSDETGEHCAQEWVLTRPELNHLARREAVREKTPDVKGGDEHDQKRSADRDQGQKVHCK